MDFNHQLIVDFFNALHEGDFTKMQYIYANDIAYFDPLHQYVNDEQVLLMWQCRFESYRSFSAEWSNIVDEGDGYYTVDVLLKYFSQRNKSIQLKLKSYLRIVDNKIAEHSDAYSIHNLCKQDRGWIGYWIGWNRMYQNRLKLEARKAFIEFVHNNA